MACFAIFICYDMTVPRHPLIPEEHKESNTGKKEPPKKQPATRQEWFLDYVKILADSGRIIDPNAMARALNTQFATQHQQEVPDDEHCEKQVGRDANSMAVFTDFYAPGGNFWFRSASGGSAAKPDDPAFRYYVTQKTTCGGYHKTYPALTASMRFSNISGFACITQQQLGSVLPQAKPLQATDGWQSYGMVTAVSQNNQVAVTFDFPAGNPCMFDITIRQGER